MKLFELHRDTDVSGISGTGVVAQGVEFDDSTCCIRWLTEYRTTVMAESMEVVRRVHGHNGSTRVVYL